MYIHLLTHEKSVRPRTKNKIKQNKNKQVKINENLITDTTYIEISQIIFILNCAFIINNNYIVILFR